MTNYYKPIWSDRTVERLLHQLYHNLLSAPTVDTGHWQAKKNVPQTQTRELTNVVIELPIQRTPGSWASWMQPNLPWAEDHFQERVSGEPLNPPPSHVYWPFNQRGNEDHMDGEVFSHSYPERLWPRFAPEPDGPSVARSPNRGIRYDYGDLRDLVQLLVEEPHTRQAYIPLWFPEDITAANQAQRVPCTLGYHFLLREGKLHCFYPMRSLDVLRYFQDDAYMAGRLCQWVIAQCGNSNDRWRDVIPGTLIMHAVSCHCFEGDIPIINHKLEKAAVYGAH